MGTYAYVNGKYINHKKAALSIDDRGTQFGDAVYEVFSIIGGVKIDSTLHLKRLARSLGEIQIEMPFSAQSFNIIIDNLIGKNKLVNGLIYFQISRGTAPRDHNIPKQKLKQNVIITTKNINLPKSFSQVKPLAIKTAIDNRWDRVDIKTIMLLPNCLAKSHAVNQGFDEVMFVKDKIITEGAAVNVFFIDKNGTLVTHPMGGILMGITRKALIECAANLKIKVEQRKFSATEIYNASEVFISSATRFLSPVYRVDDKIINDKVFPITNRLFNAYMKKVLNPDV